MSGDDTGQNVFQVGLARPGRPGPERFTDQARLLEGAKESFQRRRSVGGRDSNADALCDRAPATRCSANENIVSLYLRTVAIHHDSLKADVGNPVLPARVWTSGHV